MNTITSGITAILIFFMSSVFGQNQDAVLGTWRSGHGSGKIEIYKAGGKYFGKLIWLEEPNDENGKPKVDINNASEKLRSQPIVGLEILRNFEYTNNGFWENGAVYNPKTGRSYSGKMWLSGNNKLNIRGYMGISLIGKTETWTRVH